MGLLVAFRGFTRYSVLLVATFVAARAIGPARPADEAAEVQGAERTLASYAAKATARADTMHTMIISNSGETLHGTTGAARLSSPTAVVKTAGNHVAASAAELAGQDSVEKQVVFFTISHAGLAIPDFVPLKQKMVRSDAHSGGEVKEPKKESEISKDNAGDSGSVPSKGRLVRRQAREGGEVTELTKEQDISSDTSGNAAVTILVVVLLVVAIIVLSLASFLLFTVYSKRASQRLRPPLHTVTAGGNSDTASASAGTPAPLAVTKTVFRERTSSRTARASAVDTAPKEAVSIVTTPKSDARNSRSGHDTSDGGGAATGGTGSKALSYRDRRLRTRTQEVTQDASPHNSPRGQPQVQQPAPVAAAESQEF